MRFVIFTQSIVSDWNHGNAHFLRGIGLELMACQHEVLFLEPAEGWSRSNLLREVGESAVDEFHKHFPTLNSQVYEQKSINLDEVLKDAEVVLVHEWNSSDLIAAIGEHRSRRNYLLFFHDTHHRVLSDPAGINAIDLKHYDAVLAYGAVIRDAYLKKEGVREAFIWHEAADIRTFHPIDGVTKEGDLVWIGNWGDGEREESLREFLIKPIKRLHLRARVYGVGYPPAVLSELSDAGIDFGGWLPNYRVPEVFARFRVTVHVPRRFYVEALPGIPTIRPFEALACGIPLVSAPWNDSEHLFHSGKDFVFARNEAEMCDALQRILGDPKVAGELSEHGLNTILTRHTCRHRADELTTLAQALAAVEVAGGGG